MPSGIASRFFCLVTLHSALLRYTLPCALLHENFLRKIDEITNEPARLL